MADTLQGSGSFCMQPACVIPPELVQLMALTSHLEPPERRGSGGPWEWKIAENSCSDLELDEEVGK